MSSSSEPQPKAESGSSNGAQKDDDSSSYPLHRCIFDGTNAELSALIRRLAVASGAVSGDSGTLAAMRPDAADNPLAAADPHGNTALHLAVMMCKFQMIYLLVAHGAPIKAKNKLGWSPLAEAIRYRKSRIP